MVSCSHSSGILSSTLHRYKMSQISLISIISWFWYGNYYSSFPRLVIFFWSKSSSRGAKQGVIFGVRGPLATRFRRRACHLHFQIDFRAAHSFLPSSHVAGSFWIGAGVGHNWSQMPIYMQAPQPCGTWMFWLPCFFPCNDIHPSENFRKWGLVVYLSPEWKLASLFLLGSTFWCLALV